MQSRADLDNTAVAMAELQASFTQLLRGWAATVTVVSSQTESGEPQAMTASSFTPVCMEPPKVLVCVNKQAGLYRALHEAQPFCVNVLGETQAEAAVLCSDKELTIERFQQAGWQYRNITGQQVPFLASAQSHIFCRADECVEMGTHGIFIGAVTAVAYTDETAPLLYADRVYRRLYPDSET